MQCKYVDKHSSFSLVAHFCVSSSQPCIYPVNYPQHSVLHLRNSPEVLCWHVVQYYLGCYSGTFHLRPCSSESETAESCADATQKSIFSKLFVRGGTGQHKRSHGLKIIIKSSHYIVRVQRVQFLACIGRTTGHSLQNLNQGYFNLQSLLPFPQ